MNLPFTVSYVIQLVFFCYTVILFLRIISSWFPVHWRELKAVRFLAFYADPYLNLFRKMIPPLGGVLDLSPILAFIGLRILERILLGAVRWLSS